MRRNVAEVDSREGGRRCDASYEETVNGGSAWMCFARCSRDHFLFHLSIIDIEQAVILEVLREQIGM